MTAQKTQMTDRAALPQVSIWLSAREENTAWRCIKGLFQHDLLGVCYFPALPNWLHTQGGSPAFGMWDMWHVTDYSLEQASLSALIFQLLWLHRRGLMWNMSTHDSQWLFSLLLFLIKKISCNDFLTSLQRGLVIGKRFYFVIINWWWYKPERQLTIIFIFN